MNDIEKAIEHLETYWDSLIDIGLIDCETLCECSNALEKQIAKKIDHDYLSCNSCDGDIEMFARLDIVYCPWCGQKLDWSVEE